MEKKGVMRRKIFTPKNITKGMDILRNMKSLKVIATDGGEYNKKQSPTEFWRKYDAGVYGK